jgi:recombination protein RecA
VAPPFREVEFDILYGQGISKAGELIDLGSENGIIEKSGAWYALDGERIGQGRENARDYLLEHPDVAATIEARVRQKFGLTPGDKTTESSAEGARVAEAARAKRGGKE